MDDLVIRRSRPSDVHALERVAGRDTQVVPDGDLLVAEVSGELVAALAPASGRHVADPFRPTAAVVDLLRLRAAATAPAPSRRRRALRPRAI